jgi:predicted double-glycine peptidase
MRGCGITIVLLSLAMPAVPGWAVPIPLPGHTLLHVRVRSLVEQWFKNVVRQSYDVSGGAAALATLFQYYYGEQVTAQEIVEAMFKLGDRAKIQKEGFSLLGMRRFAEQQGYVARGYRIEEGQKLVDLKVPAITLVNVRGYAHFAVIKGVARGQVFLADPALDNRSRPLESFAQEWTGVILVVLSSTRTGDSAFALDPTLKAPVGDVMSILDRGLRSIGPAPGEF